MRAVTLLLLLALPGVAPAVTLVDKPLPDRGIERLTLELGGFFQPRFVWTEADESAAFTGELGFRVQRVRFETDGELALTPGPKGLGLVIAHKLSVEFMPEARLQDAWIQLGAGSLFEVRLGQMKAPTHRSFLVSDRETMFPERSALDGMIPRREIGAMVQGAVGREHLVWQAGIFNGEGTNRISNINRKFLVAGRIAVSPLGAPSKMREVLHDGFAAAKNEALQIPTFTVGYAIHFNVDGPPDFETATMGHNTELFFHYRWVTLQGEFLYRVIDSQDLAQADWDQAGGYLQFSLFPPMVPWIQDHIAVTFRLEQYDRFMDRKLDLPLAGPTDPGQAARDIHAGLSFYWGKPLFLNVGDLRFQVLYSVHQELEGLDYKNNTLTIAAHLSI